MQTTYDQLMSNYERLANEYDRCRLGTKKHESEGKRLDKACEALEQWRANNKPIDNRSLSERIAAL